MAFSFQVRTSCPNPGGARTFPSTRTSSPLSTTRFNLPCTSMPAKGVHLDRGIGRSVILSQKFEIIEPIFILRK